MTDVTDATKQGMSAARTLARGQVKKQARVNRESIRGEPRQSGTGSGWGTGSERRRISDPVPHPDPVPDFSQEPDRGKQIESWIMLASYFLSSRRPSSPSAVSSARTVSATP